MIITILFLLLLIINALNLLFLKRRRQIIDDLLLIVFPGLLWLLYIDYIDQMMINGNSIFFLLTVISTLCGIFVVLHDLNKNNGKYS